MRSNLLIYENYNSFISKSGAARNNKNLQESLRIQKLREQILKTYEAEVDTNLKHIKQNLKATSLDPVNREFAYITNKDLLQIYGEDTVLTIRNHKEIFKPGLMEEDDKVVLDRALIVISEDTALDVKLVSQPKEILQSVSQRSTDSGVFLSETERCCKKRKNNGIDKEKKTKRKRAENSISDDEYSNELEASAKVVLRKKEGMINFTTSEYIIIGINFSFNSDRSIFRI